MPNKDLLKDDMKKLDEEIDKFNKDIKGIISILNDVIDNICIYKGIITALEIIIIPLIIIIFGYNSIFNFFFLFFFNFINI